MEPKRKRLAIFEKRDLYWKCCDVLGLFQDVLFITTHSSAIMVIML